MKRRLPAIATLLAATGLAAPAQAQQTMKLTAAAGHPPVFLWVKLIDEFFMPEVAEKSRSRETSMPLPIILTASPAARPSCMSFWPRRE